MVMWKVKAGVAEGAATGKLSAPIVDPVAVQTVSQKLRIRTR